MPNDIQDALFAAIENIANGVVDRLQTDKTITAVVVQCNNALTGEHQVNYQGGNMVAYANEGTSYSKNDTVYVLVPEGDFTKKKLIIGKASAVGNDNNITFVSSVLNDYNTIGRNTIKHKKSSAIGLHSYLANDYKLIYDYEDEENSLVTIDIEEFQNYLKQATTLMIEASFQTRLPKEHRNSKTGIYGLQFVLAFKNRAEGEDEEGNEPLKYLSYVLDTNNMTGNPYAYNTWVDQYDLYPIDIENFSHIQSIIFYSRGFVEKDDYINDELWGADIWCNDLEIYGLKPISNTNGDYRLKLSAPYGATFKTQNPDNDLQIVASVRHKQTYLTESCMYYWFAEDARISTMSEYYQMYGGTGWKWLKTTKGTGNTFTTSEPENRAYENNYLCVAVYKEEVVLKEYFTIYNDTRRRDIGVVSDLGVKFGFDRGKPVLTCLLDNKSENFDADNATRRPDDWFTFMWSKIDDYGQVTSLAVTMEELEKAYREALEQELGYATASFLKTQMTLMEGVEHPKGVYGNQLIFPVSSIDNYATFRCSVYLKDSEQGESYFIGSADITLQNENAADPADYYILIENGDQVFQYSESGVSPSSSRYTDPQKILNLIPHFYDPAGLEVSDSTYEVKWIVPTESTMITMPTEMTMNPANNKIELFTASKQFPLGRKDAATETDYIGITDSFDYQALNNQLTCVVEYQGQTWMKDTRLSFVKVGDNGTNGTDIVAQISPNSQAPILDRDMLTLEEDSQGYSSWNTGQSIGSKVLDFTLWQRDEKILPTGSVIWSVVGSSTLISVTGDNTGAIVSRGVASAKAKNLTVKAQTVLRDTVNDTQTTYYAFWTIPFVKYNVSRSGYKLHIDTDWTLKQIIYNNDGRNPLYNKNQGVKFSLTEPNGTVQSKQLVLEAIGGVTQDETSTCAFKMILEKNNSKQEQHRKLDQTQIHFDENGECMIYILPEDSYSGLYTNNMIHGKIYSPGVNVNTATPECEFYIPIHMMLNVYGLASLNAWDGNHIEINEEDNYILAPQIGAGVKEQDNTFTGVVMGTQQTYDDQKSRKIGLMGYSKGKQSIWLDAETGNATFGLNSDSETDANNPEAEGRIELRPGGTSSISRWKINKRSFYNVVDGEIGNKYTDNWAPEGSTQGIPSDKEGILLNASPPYLSIKGRQLTAHDIDEDDLNAVVAPQNSLEVQLDPNSLNIFTILRHYQLGNGRWTRSPVVGIDTKGRFYANMIQNNLVDEDGNIPDEGEITSSAIIPGPFGAFGKSNQDLYYVGGHLDVGDNMLFKMFTRYSDINDPNGPLFLSGSNNKTNEYTRDISIHGKTVSMYGPYTTTDAPNEMSNTSEVTNNMIQVGFDKAIVQANFSKLTLSHSNDSLLNINSNYKENIEGTSTIVRKGNVSSEYQKNNTLTIKGKHTETITEKVAKTWNAIETNTLTIHNHINATINNKADNKWKFTTEDNSLKIGTSNNSTISSTAGGVVRFPNSGSSFLTLSNKDGNDSILASTGKMLVSCRGELSLTCAGDAGIRIIAAPANATQYNISNTNTASYLFLDTSQGGNGNFYLNSSNGSVYSAPASDKQQYNAICVEDVLYCPTLIGTGARNVAGHDAVGIYAKTSVFAEEALRTPKDCYAGNHRFTYEFKAPPHYCYGWIENEKYKSNNISDHIWRLYDAINSVAIYADNRANQAEKNAKDWVGNQGYATTTWVNNNFASAGHGHDYATTGSVTAVDNRISVVAAQFIGHKHTGQVGGQSFTTQSIIYGNT